jgi:superoxide dismutase, Cu-Zn family
MSSLKDKVIILMKKTFHHTIFRMISKCAGILALFSILSCSAFQRLSSHPFPDAAEAVAHMAPSSESQVFGKVEFFQEDRGLRIVAKFTGLPGNSRHGFHIHEFGDCSHPTALSAGGHYDLDGHAHGSPMSSRSHIGDLGNLTADQKGEIQREMLVPRLSLKDQNAVLGRSVVLHAEEDDLESQPAGNSGARISCGVIGIQAHPPL